MVCLLPSASRIAALAAIAISAASSTASAEETAFVKAALAHGGFRAFVDLVSRAGLTDTLGAGPVTVFMPTDAAFARLSAAQRRSIADLSPDGVRDFVHRFVFPGTVMASNDIDQTITSENGTPFDVTWYKGRLSLRDEHGPATGRLAYVVQGDIPAGIGVIDAVDAVLMPSATGLQAVPAAAEDADGDGQAAKLGNPVPSGSTPEQPPAAPGRFAPVPSPMSHTTPAPPVSPPSTVAVPPPTDGAIPPLPPPAAPGPVVSPSVATPVGSPSVPQPAPPSIPSASAAPTPAPAVPPPVAIPPVPLVNVATARLMGWPMKVSGNGSTGKVNGLIIGLPDGRISGLTAHFGGFLGFGGRTVYIPWTRVTADAKAHVLRAQMTAAEFAAAPAHPPKS